MGTTEGRRKGNIQEILEVERNTNIEMRTRKIKSRRRVIKKKIPKMRKMRRNVTNTKNIRKISPKRRARIKIGRNRLTKKKINLTKKKARNQSLLLKMKTATTAQSTKIKHINLLKMRRNL